MEYSIRNAKCAFQLYSASISIYRRHGFEMLGR